MSAPTSPATSPSPARSPSVRAAVDLASLLAARAKSSPDRPAITPEGQTRTFAQTQDRVERLAAVLHNGGVAAGDRIAYLGLNHPAILATLFATAKLGTILVPSDVRLTGYKLPRQLEIVDSLPRNATGKVLKTELRARFDQPPENGLEQRSARSPQRD